MGKETPIRRKKRFEKPGPDWIVSSVSSLGRLLVAATLLTVALSSQAATKTAISNTPGKVPSTATLSATQIEADRQEAQAFLQEGKRFLKNGMLLEAADLFEAVLSNKNATDMWPEALLLAGKAYLATSKEVEPAKFRSKACQRFEKLVNSYPKSALVEDALFLWGSALFNGGDYIEAEPKFRELLARFPETKYGPEAEYHLGRIFESTQKYLVAQRKYYRVIEYYRHPAKLVQDSMFRLANICTLLGKNELAAKWYELACKRNRQRCLMDKDALFNRGKVYLALGEDERAVRELERFVNLYPDDTRYYEALLMAGTGLERTGKLPVAGLFLKAAAASTTANVKARALLKLATIQQDKGVNLTNTSFKELYQQIVDEFPYTQQAMEASVRLAKYLIDRQDYKAALGYLDWFFDSYGENKFTNTALDARERAILGVLKSYVTEGDFYEAAITFEGRLGQLRKRSSLSQARFWGAWAYFELMGYKQAASVLLLSENRHLTAEQRRQKKLLTALQSYLENRPELAVPQLSALAEGRSDAVSLKARCRLVDLLLRAGRTSEALKQYARLGERYIDDRLALSLDFRMGMQLREASKFAEAKKAFDRFTRLHLKRRQMELSAAATSTEATLACGQKKEAVSRLDCASYLVVSAFIQKAQCCYALGEKREACLLLEQVIGKCQLSPLVHQACCLLIDYYISQGLSDKAAGAQKRCKKVADKEPLWKQAETLINGEIEVNRRLEELSSWWRGE